VPSRTIQEVLRIISNFSADAQTIESDIVKIYVSDNQILFSLDSVEIISRLISGQYPDYRQIIPDKYKTEVVLRRQDLIRAIKASSIFSKTGIYEISTEYVTDGWVTDLIPTIDSWEEFRVNTKEYNKILSYYPEFAKLKK
jgi:DNA polymerase-3 subunit beta